MRLTTVQFLRPSRWHRSIGIILMKGGCAMRAIASPKPSSKSTGRATSGQDLEPFTLEESRALFDKTARLYLNMSGEEFLKRWDLGDFRDVDSRPQVMRVASLIPLVRKTSARQKPF